jgi:SAM-dependent methyltransferase
MQFPEEFDAAAYRSRYPDLSALSPTELRRHWLREGLRNGRNAAPIERPKQLLECLSDASHLLEIGPFDKPSLESIRGPGQEIHYADHLSQSEMVERARQIPGRDPGGVPPIRYVLSQGGYQQISQKYDVIVSHHCLEHQPDLINHFQEVARLLKPGGVYLCTLPDKRRCFDRYLPLTTLIDVVTAHLEQRTHPPLQAVIEHRCFTVQNWVDAPDPTKELDAQLPHMLELALKEYQSHPYVDVHCWKFTSQRLRKILGQLVTLGHLPKDSNWLTYNLGDEIAAVIAFDEQHNSNPQDGSIEAFAIP